MPTRTRPSTTTVVEVPKEAQHPMLGLQFNEPLSWKAGKSIAVADLLRRLQTLSKELRDIEQEEEEKASFTKVAKELASPNLLAHRDKGVKAWTACCLVDILRICAPDAPYTVHQLRDIFTMLITYILPALSDPANAYNTQHMHVLQSLAQVKSIVLVTDLPSSEPLTIHLFTSFFDMLSGSSKNSTGEPLSKNVEFNMTAILVVMVDEAPSLPTEAVDSIIAQFFRTDPRTLGQSSLKGKKNGLGGTADEKQSTLVLRDLPPAYNMAKTICNSCPEKMAREVSQYFTEVITSASKSYDKPRRKNNEDHGDMDAGPDEDDMKELHKAHTLLRELWRASPSVLQNVIPQLEAELSAEKVELRLLATETFGDIISGIGTAGPPPLPSVEVDSYPPTTLSSSSDRPVILNLLTTPSSPQPFPQVHPHAYNSFLSRKQDKSPAVRAAWTTGIGRILTTSGGGVGLSQHDTRLLVEHLARMLNDSDEKVRIAAVKAVGTFHLKDVVNKLGSSGTIETSGSVLANLSERARDQKPAVKTEAMKILARIWAISVGEIAAGNEQVISLVGGAVSKILNVYYTNDLDAHVLQDHVLFEILLPLSYPPIKSKVSKLSNGNSQSAKDSQKSAVAEESLDVDKIRVERMLLLAKRLDERAKGVFFAYQAQQVQLTKYMSAYLQSCEEYNGGVIEKDEDVVKTRLTTIINALAKLLPNSSKSTSDLWKFAKMHDRRSYQLIRFCMAPESDYRTMFKAMKEFTKRIETSNTTPAGLLDTLTPLLYRSSLILYNKSHVPAIIEYAKTDENSLGGIAHEILTDMSNKTPEVLKAQVQEICRNLQEGAPLADKANDASAVNNLKACATFAKRFPKEIPQDRKFVQAMTSYALQSSPPEAAKYAISIIMAASEKKEMIAKDLVHKCVKDFEYGKDGFLSRLAALSQLWLLAPTEMDKDSDAVIDIAIKEILLQVRSPPSEPTDDYTWEDNLDSECQAKCWALKILVNRLRSHPHQSSLSEIAQPIYTLIEKLISDEGELDSTRPTPPNHKPHLRLLAARLFLKLCVSKPHEALLSSSAFNKLALVAQDALFPVRASFLQRLKKYLTQNKLPLRFYTIPFLIAFEPDNTFKAETATWIKSRALFLSNLKPRVPAVATYGSKSIAAATKASTILEAVFARLVSLLAHHPDYDSSTSDLVDFSRYILFYLSNVANEENISLIYHIAQRIKGCQDAVSAMAPSQAKSDMSDERMNQNEWDERLYTLSDLAQVTIRAYEEAQNWSIQTLPTMTRLSLPKNLYSEIRDHETAMDIAEKVYLPEGDEVKEGVEKEIRRAKAFATHGRKRRSEGGDGTNERGAKKPKSLPVRNSRTKSSKPSTVPKRKSAPLSKKSTSWNPSDNDDAEEESPREIAQRSSEVPASERRRSGRKSGVEAKYLERDDSEDDEEMEEMNREEQDDRVGSADEEQGEEDVEVDDEDTPLTPPSNMETDELVQDDDEEIPPPSPPKTRSPRNTKARVKEKAKPSPKSKSTAKPTAKPPPPKQVKPSFQKPKAQPKSKSKPKPISPAASKASPLTTRSTRSRPAPPPAVQEDGDGDDDEDGEEENDHPEKMQIDETSNVDVTAEIAESELSDLPDSEEEGGEGE